MLDLAPGIKDNVAGLYDRQNDTWYASGSGTPLIAGPVYVPSTAKQAKLKVFGYRRMETIENFQALVKLSDGDDYGFSYAEAGGSTATNIWFTSEDGTTVYPHEIDKWDTSGDSFVWVRLPELKQGTTFKMHWSNNASDVQSASGNVWDGFVGVWHMNATGTTAEPDSTANGFNATPYITSGTANINRDANGKVGSGRANIQNANLRVSDYKDKLTSQTAFTMSGWFKQSTTDNSWPRLFVGNPSNTDRSCWEMWRESASALNAIGNGTSKTVSWSVSLGTDWHYLTLVYNGTTATLYDNGVGKGDKTVNTPQHKTYLSIGGAGTTADRSFVGTFDEVRMYNGALSADRIAADYATMNDPTSFITLEVPPQNEPDVYIDYVESDGRQWVETSLNPNANMTIEADIDIISGGDVVGCSNYESYPITVNNGYLAGRLLRSGFATTDIPVPTGRKLIVSSGTLNGKLTISVDGVVKAQSGGTCSVSTTGKSMYVFAAKDGSRSSAKLYGMKIYINGVLERDYVPGIKNGVVGLYDRVYDVWYHSGSGIELNPGPVTEPHNTPDAYLDYVKSTGAQYVNVSVGLTLKQTMKFDVDVDWISGNGLMAQNNYGLSPLTAENGTIVSRWWMADAAASANTGVKLDTGRRRFIITTSNAAYLSASVDGGTPALSGGYSNRSGVNPSDLYIFAKHYGGLVGNAGEYSTAKLYGLKIYGANGVLMRDYVPGIKNNVVGLYDRVGDKFYSSGSGTPLVAGPVVDRSKPDSFVEYVESNGSQWVDTGVDGRAGVKAEADIDWISGVPLGVIGNNNNHFLLLQALGGIGGQALGSGEVKTGIAVNSGRHLIVSEVPAGSKMTITVDGTTTAQSSGNVSASGNTGMTIWMFAAHHYSGGKWGEGASKFYELKLWRTGSDGVSRIQRHFIPCLKDNRAGLYDAVSGVIFYSHSGTDLVAPSTPRTLSVWRNEADDASLDNAANWCGGLPNGTDAVVCAPWVPSASATDGFAFANLTVSGGDLAFADGTNTVTGALAADGALAFTNLVINGSADCAVAVSGVISGHGTVNSLTLAEGARFIPDGDGYLMVSDALVGTMLIDMTDINLSGMTGRFPLFKTGTVDILPAATAVEFVGGRPPSGRKLFKAKSGFGYDLSTSGFAILLR